MSNLITSKLDNFPLVIITDEVDKTMITLISTSFSLSVQQIVV